MPSLGNKPPKDVNQRLRRFWGMITMIGVLVTAGAVLVSISAGVHLQENNSFSVVKRVKYTHTYDPIVLAQLGLPPTSSRQGVKIANPEVRSILVYPHLIELTSAGKEVRSIYTQTPATNIYEVKQLINDNAWIEETSFNILTLKAALISYKGVNMTVGSSKVIEVDMLDQPSVFIGTRAGTLNFSHVTVKAVTSPSLDAKQYQPFVLATGKATMNVVDSHFSNLGWDWNASYGVSWELGSTGKAVGSSFSNGFIGVYTGEANNLLFKNDTFSNNALYGLDPHTGSTKLTIDHVLAQNNRAHGIIFSDHVTNSIIKNSVSRNNGENGIMMDKFSEHNRIENNSVSGNTGDGLVTAKSPNNTFSGNDVQRNRIGVRVSEDGTQNLVFSNNKVIRNGLASDNISLNESNLIRENGGQWNWSHVGAIWLGALILMLIITAIGALIYKASGKRRPVRLSAV